MNHIEPKHDYFPEEERQILELKIRMKNIDFDKFELLFRQLSKDPKCPNDYDIRMTFNSLKKGLKLIYGSQGNDQLALIMFNYFSKGIRNYEVKFS